MNKQNIRNRFRSSVFINVLEASKKKSNKKMKEQAKKKPDTLLYDRSERLLRGIMWHDYGYGIDVWWQRCNWTKVTKMNKSRNNITTTNDPCIEENKIYNPRFYQFGTSLGHNNNMSMEKERRGAHSSEEKNFKKNIKTKQRWNSKFDSINWI